jgi:NAD(P)-dependent dehydrogenase (short-subunit alcohol dehydrogenase family)
MNTLDLFDLSGKVAIVTGGATGLGSQIARALADLGADIVLCARDGARCEEAAASLRELGVRAIGMACDVRDLQQIERVVSRTVDEFGRLDVLVNNSGTTWAAPPEDVPRDGWQKVLDVNLTGLFFFCQAAGRVMIEQGSGTIVNVASITAFRGAAPEAMDAIAYNASKGGVVSLSIDLAVKWARHGVRVNVLAPGWFPTEMANELLEGAAGDLLRSRIPLGRFGGAQDLQGAAAFLASPASAFMTGQVLAVDGGQLAFG